MIDSDYASVILEHPGDSALHCYKAEDLKRDKQNHRAPSKQQTLPRYLLTQEIHAVSNTRTGDFTTFSGNV